MDQAVSNLDFDPETEYRAIETALLESARGRWFLAEHSRRARRLDSAVLQDAIGRLQSSLREPPALLSQLRNEIVSLQKLLRETRSALVTKPRPQDSNGNGGGVAALTSGPDGILAAAEGIHELAWTLHSQEISVDTCEKIARQASSIYALSVRHAAESERVQQLTVALDAALGRLDGLLETLSGTKTSEAAQPAVLEGEHLFATERMVVSPGAGIFDPNESCIDGTTIEVGQLLGMVGSMEVRSSFAGEIKGVLAYDGERVTSRQPIAWLRTRA